MTCREKLAKEHPDYIDGSYCGGCCGCPGDSNLLYIPGATLHGSKCLAEFYDCEPDDETCSKCWNREVGGAEVTTTSAIYADNLQIDIHKLIDDAMKKKDRSVTIYIGESGVSVTVTPLDEPAHWERIVLSNSDLFGRVRYRCSNCKTISNYASHFCPTCGEEMHGVKEVKE